MRQKTLCSFISAVLIAAAQAQPSSSIFEQAADYIQRGKSASAIALLEPRLRETPEDLKALTLVGMAHAAENRREQATQYFRQALKVNPRFAPALKNLALNELALGQNDAAKN